MPRPTWTSAWIAIRLLRVLRRYVLLSTLMSTLAAASVAAKSKKNHAMGVVRKRTNNLRLSRPAPVIAETQPRTI